MFMTPSEWEVMRIIWTKRSVSSLDVIEVMQRKRDWSESTIKTLLGRLTKKNILATTKEGRHFNYRPTVPETAAMDETVTELFQHLCDMKKGAVIINLLAKLNLSKGDIERMQAQLDKKLKDAPSTINCNCLYSGKNDCYMTD